LLKKKRKRAFDSNFVDRIKRKAVKRASRYFSSLKLMIQKMRRKIFQMIDNQLKVETKTGDIFNQNV
jgi:hypothetical protein